MKNFVFSVASRATGRLQIKPSGSGDENEHSWTALRMSRPLFVGSYLQVTWGLSANEKKENLLWMIKCFVMLRYVLFVVCNKAILVMVGYSRYEISRHKKQVVKPFLSENACFFNFFQQ